ncbi:hypothetical protein DPEC_G00071300 [Dallia pectoralis]|uniref:Uncharacterized protein n=1 Tax=Dallia pectoralis TaxID=75939 RepID=A0ACC2H2F4_DALPE|nr:hypothetical protein DPEC_G00071300 [Dallia pectoralis]
MTGRLETVQCFYFGRVGRCPARCSGRESKIDIPIALGWLFSNSLMARFNMKGTKGKTALEKTKVYIAIQDGVMTCDAAATDGIIKMDAAEHLKHHKEVELAETLKTNLLVLIVF